MERVKRLHVGQTAQWAADPATYSRLDSFLKANHDQVLGLIGYTSVFLSELIKNWPKIKLLVSKLLYRLRLINKSPGDLPEALTERQLHLAKTLNSIYGYIADIRIAQGIFYIVPYIVELLTDYNTPSKLKLAFRSWEALDKFVTFLLFGNYQWLENFAFLLQHEFLPNGFNFFLLDKHKKDTSLSTSDWAYVYSCSLWCVWNIISNVKTWRKGQVDFNLLCDLILSYHWARPDGFLARPQFAVIGFANTVTKFRKLFI